MQKYLIINADDFGMCRAHNVATEELLLSGRITSATIMAPCPFARDAVKFAVSNPSLSVGVHLTTTSEWHSYRWGGLAKDCPSLSDADGFFHRTSTDFAKNADPVEVEAELTAQIEMIRSFGLEPSHLDNHMGSLYGITNGDFTFLKIAFNTAAKYGLPFRFPSKISHGMLSNGTLDIKLSEEELHDSLDAFVNEANKLGVLTPDYLIPGDWLGEQDKSFENYREYIFELYRKFEPGITETYIHPAIECEEIKRITPFWHRRVWEYKLFSDKKTTDFIKSLGIKLIGYKYLQKISL